MKSQLLFFFYLSNSVPHKTLLDHTFKQPALVSLVLCLLLDASMVSRGLISLDLIEKAWGRVLSFKVSQLTTVWPSSPLQLGGRSPPRSRIEEGWLFGLAPQVIFQFESNQNWGLMKVGADRILLLEIGLDLELGQIEFESAPKVQLS